MYLAMSMSPRTVPASSRYELVDRIASGTSTMLIDRANANANVNVNVNANANANANANRIRPKSTFRCSQPCVLRCSSHWA